MRVEKKGHLWFKKQEKVRTDYIWQLMLATKKWINFWIWLRYGKWGKQYKAIISWFILVLEKSEKRRQLTWFVAHYCYFNYRLFFSFNNLCGFIIYAFISNFSNVFALASNIEKFTYFDSIESEMHFFLCL